MVYKTTSNKKQVWNGKTKKLSFKPKGKYTKYDLKQNRMMSKLYAIVKPEVKQYFGDSAVIPFYSGTPSLFQPLVLIAQGTTSSTRIGDKIKLMNISIKWQLNANATSPFVRLITVRNVGTTVLTSGDFTGTNDFFDKAKIYTYKDSVLSINPNTLNRRGTFQFNYPKGLIVDYTNLDKAQLLFVAIQDLPLAYSSTIQYTYCITYTDA